MSAPLLDLASGEGARILQWRARCFEPWYSDPKTTDIAVNRPGTIWVRQRGVWGSHKVPLDLNTLRMMAVRSGALRDQEVGPHDPICDADWPDGTRWNSVEYPCVPKGTIAASLRKHNSRSIEDDGDIARHYRSENWQRQREIAADNRRAPGITAWKSGNLNSFLTFVATGALNAVFVGATGAGKTTLAHRMCGKVPMTKRIVIIQDSDELKLLHPNHVSLLYSSGVSDGTGINAGTLSRAAHRMRPDRLIIQELRDDAAVVYIRDSSHRGTFVTVHGRSAADAVRRIFHLVKTSTSGSSMEDMTVMRSIAAVVDVIIPLREESDEFHIEDVWFAPMSPLSVIDLMTQE